MNIFHGLLDVGLGLNGGKLNGYRAIGVSTRGAVLYSRNGQNFNKRYPHLAECLTTLPSETVVDVEIVAMDGSGPPEPNHCSHPEINPLSATSTSILGQ